MTDFGVFAMDNEKYVPVGFNAWRDTDNTLSVGEVAEEDRFGIEGTALQMKGIDAPAGFWKCAGASERDAVIKKNMRGVLQLFGVKVHVYPERVEINGAIPPQVILASDKEERPTASIIRSPSRGEELCFIRGGLATPLSQAPATVRLYFRGRDILGIPDGKLLDVDSRRSLS